MQPGALCLDIGGVTFEVRADAGWLAALHKRYEAFLVEGQADWTVTLLAEPALDAPAAPWVRHDDATTTFHVGYSRGVIDLGAGAAQVYAPSPVSGPAAVERVLAFLCSHDLPRRHNALLLHGAAVVRRGHGLALVGRSGTGKTTAARLASGHADVLTDESLIVSLAGGRPLLVSTPFWGASTPRELIQRVRRAAPLRALLLLEHGARFRLEPLSAGEAALALLTTEKLAVERVSSATAWLEVAGRLAAATPVYRLSSLPATELWSFLDRELEL
jgi:hypothetical protein